MASRQGRRQDDSNVAARGAARKEMRLDAQILLFGDWRLGAIGHWGMRARGLVDPQQASNALLGFACLSIFALIVRAYRRQGRPADLPSRRSVGMMGAFLVVCGLSQFTTAIVAMPVSRVVMISLLASITCWAAALTLVPLLARPALSHDDEDIEREIAERQKAEEALRQSEEETRKLAEADVRKNEFLAMLGHELRNPLAPIRNAVKIMKQRGSDDPDLCWARDVVDHQVRQMGQLVDELLEISRVTSGKVRLQKEPIDVATIVAYAVETSRPTIEQQHHRLSIALPPSPVFVEADSIRMAQVLSNLLNNAAKYTKPGGQIRLAVAVEGADVAFRVRDTGIGIPAEMLSQVFDLFTQVDHSLDHSQGGLGLGLTLVQNLVEMHGGTVQALSEGPNRGSEFVVCLPILIETTADTAPSAKTAPLPGTRSPLREDGTAAVSRRVLVVDDNVSAAQSLAMVLKLEGYDVQVAHDGAVVLDATRRFRPEVVLLDIGLPNMDGYELARRLRQEHDLAAGIALLVAVTGYAEDEARRRSQEAGFDHHLVKPIDPDGLLALLSSLEWAETTEPVENASCPSLKEERDLAADQRG
jgi:signal transduction histidine kinase/FixJ family two-component response regulator